MSAVSPAILAQSCLARLPEELRAQVLAGCYVVEVPAGAHTPPSRAPKVALVLDGLVRMFLQSPAGRQVTVRYARPGDLLGLVHLLGAATQARAQSVTSARLCVLDGDVLRALAARHAELALMIAEECAARTADAMDELALVSFGSVRQRVARHLLDLSAARPPDGELVAVATQQELADACGSVREVVARVLKELHAEQLTAPAPNGVAILDVSALDAVTRVT